MKTIFRQANVTIHDYAHLESSTAVLHLCRNNTESARPTECPIIWPLPEAKHTTVNGRNLTRSSMEIVKNFTNSGQSTGLNLIGVPRH